MEIPTGYAQANLIFDGVVTPTGAQVTLGFDVSGYSGTPTDLAEDIVAQLDANNVNDNWSDDVHLASVLVKYGPTATGPSGEWNGSLPGTLAGSSLPPQVAILVKKVTSFGGRAGRGRMYIPGVREVDVNESGIVGSTLVSDITATWNNFAADMVLMNAEPVLLHGDNSPLSTPSPIIAFSCDGTAATQRRRLRR